MNAIHTLHMKQDSLQMLAPTTGSVFRATLFGCRRNTGLLKMIFGALTTCHTQYT